MSVAKRATCFNAPLHTLASLLSHNMWRASCILFEPQNRLLFVAEFPARATAALGLAFLDKKRRGAQWQDTPCTAGTSSCALQVPG
jgi:hypothetical protein